MKRKLSNRELQFIRADQTRQEKERAEKRASKPVFRGEKRQGIVSDLMDRMRDWRLTPFENEGPAVASIRSVLCLDGYDWTRSDREANALVGQCLSKLGAVRPTHQQGQPEYAISEDYCAWCHGPTDGTERFCSSHCATAIRQHRTWTQERQRDSIYQASRRILRREAMPIQDCAYCSTPFRPVAYGVSCCSKHCATMWKLGDRALTVIACETCGTEFQPRNRRDQYCSLRCSGIGVAERQRQAMVGTERCCVGCGEAFTPASASARYCIPTCRRTHLSRLRKARERIERHGDNVLPLHVTPPLFDCSLSA